MSLRVHKAIVRIEWDDGEVDTPEGIVSDLIENAAIFTDERLNYRVRISERDITDNVAKAVGAMSRTIMSVATTTPGQWFTVERSEVRPNLVILRFCETWEDGEGHDVRDAWMLDIEAARRFVRMMAEVI